MNAAAVAGPAPWPVEPRDLLPHLAAALARRDRELALEQAVAGLDALDEAELHPILAAGLEHAGYGVAREAPYPAPPRAISRPPRRAEQDRCDLVVLPGAGLLLADPTHDARLRHAERGTLFEGLGDGPTLTTPPRTVAPAGAVWIEVKAVGQHCYRHGVPGPNPAYASELVSLPAADAGKLAAAHGIGRAAALLVLACEDPAVARHDLIAATHRLLDRGLPVGSPDVAEVEIGDRIGNRALALALWGVTRPPPD